VVENKGSGASLIQELRREGVRIQGITPTAGKVMRVNAQLAVLEQGAVHLPREAPWRAGFLAELAAFPNGRHDDQVDSLVQALEAARNRPVQGRAYSFRW
jgi:predicted phage terminase large subunit-like protein